MDIKLNLDSLEGCRDLYDQVIVVDDASPDNSADIVAGYSFVTLIKNDKNLGFPRTCNIGLAHCTGEVVIFLNSDCAVDRWAMIRLIESLMKTGSIGAAGPYTNNAGYGQAIFCTYPDLNHLGLFCRDFAHRDAEDKDVPMLVGFCLAVKMSVLKEVGGFNEEFGRGMFEDNELALRIQVAKYRCVLSGRAFIHHTGSRSLSRMPESPSVLLERNKRRYHEMYQAWIDSGFISHLPGQRAEPIVIRPERHPDVLAKEFEKLRKRADISLIMMVKNEESCLDDCLKSAKVFVNQIIVVDTGSTDRTKEIALFHGAKVYDFPFNGFSEPRNESLRHATGRNCIYLDADDVVPFLSAEAILRAVVSAPKDVTHWFVPVQFVGEGPNVGVRVDHAKIFRNLPGLNFMFSIHEQILSSIQQHPGRGERIPGAYVLHLNYDSSPEGQERKRIRDEPWLQKDVNDFPDHPMPRFNIGMTRFQQSEFAEALAWLRECTDRAAPTDSITRKAFALLGGSHLELGEPELALQAYTGPSAFTILAPFTSRWIAFGKRSLTSGSQTEAIVVDNASADGTVEIVAKIAKSNPRVRFILNDANIGYAKAMNQAILLTTGEHILLLNPDCEVYPGLLKGLRSRIKGNVVAAGPVCDTVVSDQFVEFYLPPGHRPMVCEMQDHLAYILRGFTKPAKLLAGFCLMVPRRLFDKHGLLDEAMELGADDLELSWRVQALGYELAIAGDLFVHHEGGVSFRSLPVEERELRIQGGDDALSLKLEAVYGVGKVPYSKAIWGCEVFAAAFARMHNSEADS